MIKRAAISILIVAMLASFAIAGRGTDDLQPDRGVFSAASSGQYYLALRDALLGGHPFRMCQVLAVPSFEREWAVYLVRDDDGAAQVIFRTMKTHLWAEMTRKIEQGTTGNVFSTDGPAAVTALAQLSKAVEGTTAPFSESTAILLERVWAEMLARVRYPEPARSIGLDGTTYYVAHFEREAGFRSGTTWSPDVKSHAGALIEIAEVLRQYALAQNKKRPGLEVAIAAKAKALLAQLNDAVAPAPARETP